MSILSKLLRLGLIYIFLDVPVSTLSATHTKIEGSVLVIEKYQNCVEITLEKEQAKCG